MMAWRDIVTLDGSLSWFTREGLLRRITVNGHPHKPLGGGWRPRGLYTGCAGYGIAEMNRDDGSSACWVVDKEGALISHGLAVKDPRHAEAFAKAVRADIRGAVAAYLTSPTPWLDPGLTALLSLGEQTRITYYQAFGFAPQFEADPIPKPGFTHIATLGEEDLEWTGRDGVVRSISPARIRAALAWDPNEWFLRGCANEGLEWPALGGEGMARDVRCLVQDYKAMYLRCVDPVGGFVYFILLSAYGGDRVSGLYIPEFKRIFGKAQGAHQFDGHGRGLAFNIVHHAMRYGTAHLDWLRHKVQGYVHFMWPASDSHLGHYVWNELTGLNMIVSRLDATQLPAVAVLSGTDAPDFYGPIEELYPELAGRIGTEHRDYNALIKDCYARKVQPYRAHGMWIPAAVRERVMRAVMHDSEIGHIAPLLEEDADTRTVTFGLRLFDRTMVDPEGFYFAVIQALLAHCRRLTVVIDGLNVKPGRPRASVFKSFAADDLRKPAIEREREIAERLRQRCAGLPVRIVDCVGASVRYSLYWIARSQMFVAPWGGGLVKYRWICNKPGYVMSNRLNLGLPHHIRIYNMKEFMEDPAPLEFAEIDVVTDLRGPDQQIGPDGLDPGMRRGSHVSSANFELDMPRVLARITDLFVRTMPPPPVAATLPVEEPPRPVAGPPLPDPIPDVMPGMDGYLFLTGGSHRVLEFVAGRIRPSPQSHANFAANIAERARISGSIGARYLHVVFPDKQSVLPEMFPYPVGETLTERYLRLAPEVVPLVCSLQAILADQPRPVFARTDTHLTDFGTIAATAHIVERLTGAAHPEITALLTDALTEGPPQLRDLGSKVTPPIPEAIPVCTARWHGHSFVNDLSGGNNGLVNIRFNTAAPIRRRLLWFGDSFGRQACQFLAFYFQEVIFLRTGFFHPDMAAAIRPDIVITQNIERYFSHWISDNDRPSFYMYPYLGNAAYAPDKTFATAFSAVLGSDEVRERFIRGLGPA